MTGDRGDASGIACDRGDAVVRESNVIPGDTIAAATDTASPAAAVTTETQQGHDISMAASPCRRILRETSSLGDMLARVMDEPSSNESVTDETRQVREVSVVSSPRRRILKKTSSLGTMLARIMDEPSSTESVTAEVRQVQEVSVVSSPRRRILRKTSSSCLPVPFDGSAPPVVPAEGEVWHRFSPSVIDPALCLARTFNAGAGGQCKRKPRTGEVTCAMCKTPVHGRVDGPIPENKLASFLRAAKRV